MQTLEIASLHNSLKHVSHTSKNLQANVSTPFTTVLGVARVQFIVEEHSPPEFTELLFLRTELYVQSVASLLIYMNMTNTMGNKNMEKKEKKCI